MRPGLGTKVKEKFSHTSRINSHRFLSRFPIITFNYSLSSRDEVFFLIILLKYPKTTGKRDEVFFGKLLLSNI